MKELYSIKEIRDIRRKYKRKFFQKGNFEDEEYKFLIHAHMFTIKKYQSNFKHFFNAYFKNRDIEKYEKKVGIKLKHLKETLPTFREVYFLVTKLPSLKKDYLEYFIKKTCLSYEINVQPQPFMKRKKKVLMKEIKKHWERDYRIKFAEFCYLLLAEYLILHNYMNSSGFKHKNVRSIDKYLKNIKPK